jgi:hypothetical protein
MKKAAATKKYRRLSRRAVEAEGIETCPWERAEGRAAFFHAQKRRRDGPNYNASLKAAIDGLVDAGLLSDDDHEHFALLPPRFEIDKEHPRVELTIERKA